MMDLPPLTESNEGSSKRGADQTAAGLLTVVLVVAVGVLVYRSYAGEGLPLQSLLDSPFLGLLLAQPGIVWAGRRFSNDESTWRRRLIEATVIVVVVAGLLPPLLIMLLACWVGA